MSKRRDLERHLRTLGEIKDIMNAMKNLALMETRKLTRVLATQHRVVNDITAAAADFLSFHRHLIPANDDTDEIRVLVGSERGFCGDFNESILRVAATRPRNAPCIVVGSRLADRLSDDVRVIARLAGPSVLEEVEPVLLKLMEALDAWGSQRSPSRPLTLQVLHHRAADDAVRVAALQPFAEAEARPPVSGYPPLLNVEPRALLAQLTDQYLFAALHGIFYDSLMAENQRRMQHMDYAVRRIEQDSERLLLQRNSLRQEEITEEIEIIMLSLQNAL
jgi:F-type H+-transporting ATPase subunit gamma